MSAAIDLFEGRGVDSTDSADRAMAVSDEAPALDVLEAENRLLKKQLDDFVLEARRNEAKLRKFQELELKLFGLNALPELVEAVLHPDAVSTSWDVISLQLFDPAYEIQWILGQEGIDWRKIPGLICTSGWEALEPYRAGPSFLVRLGRYSARRHGPLFNHVRRKPASVAMLPLLRDGRVIGSLNIGSYDARRFVQGVRTDFLEHFAAVVAICIENAINTERLKHQGLTDTLTSVNNRRYFDQRLDEEIKQLRRSGKPLSCMLLDIDHFKRVNDTYGHQVGDLVLREVAALIRAQLRGNDVLSRYGGEEFSALLADTTPDEAVEVAERIRQAVEARTFEDPASGPFRITLSIGVVTLKIPPNSPVDTRGAGKLLVGHADRVLYEAKEAGRNRVMSAGEVCAVGCPEEEAL